MGADSPAAYCSELPAMSLRPCWITPSVQLIPLCSRSRCGAKSPARRIPANLFGICFERFEGFKYIINAFSHLTLGSARKNRGDRAARERNCGDQGIQSFASAIELCSVF